MPALDAGTQDYKISCVCVCLNEDGFPNSKNFVQTADSSFVFKRRVAGPLITFLFLYVCRQGYLCVHIISKQCCVHSSVSIAH